MIQAGGSPFYRTSLGSAHNCTIEDFLDSKVAETMRGKVDLILTSPPFALNLKKKYGNLTGDDYKKWIVSLARPLGELLAPQGSLVMEIGNAWEPKRPVQSTLPLETLIDFAKEGDLHVCQQLICHNPARLPSPAAWVTIRRIRLKDSFTHVWWYSKSEDPHADNRQVLGPYSESMQRLLKRRSYNSGPRPSGHKISETSFLTDHGGAISPSMLQFSGTGSDKRYREWCKANNVPAHPARMQPMLAEFLIKFLTKPDGLVFDPFGGSNTTGRAAETLNRRWLITEPSMDYLIGSMGKFDTGHFI